jgi:ABC-2 type transport system ATP-binding protein
MSDAAIELRGVHRRMGGREVLAGVDLGVAPGETVALVGANGAGKSTLIRALLDLRAIDRGTIRLEGHHHTERRARARVAYLPERFQPPYYLAGRGFIDYMLALYGVPPAEVPVAEVCATLGLDAAALARSVQTYSKGMAQLLGLAACLLSRRPLLVLDEPMSGLDPAARLRLQEALAQRRADGATVLFSTHLMADAEALADRVAILHGGRIVADARPRELARHYGADTLETAFVHCVGEGAPVAGRPH